MRPLTLELDGFTSFRERTEVSFEDTDIFVLTGRTGSGKSSLIDAMVFALYGTVPRYENRNLVAPVISQGKVEARVRLDFEVGGRRFTAVRVVRRNASGGASTKEAVLEEVGADGSTTLANTADELTGKIEDEVIGLSFDHFTKCVVLPQGEFATFLRSRPAVRQRLLERLLGLNLYEKIQQAANRRAVELNARVDLLERMLEGLAHATADAVDRLENRVATLEELQREVRDTEKRMGEIVRGEEQARDRVEAIKGRRARLTHVSVPAGVEDLVRRHTNAERALREAEAALEAAGDRRRAAREKRRELPERAVLSRFREKRQELADVTGEVGRTAQEVAEAEGTLAELADATPRAVAEAEVRVGALEALRSEVEREQAVSRKLADEERELLSRADNAAATLDTLRLNDLPEGARAADRLRRKTVGELGDARDRLDEARAGVAEIETAQSSLPERAYLEKIRERREEIAKTESAIADLADMLAEREKDLEQALAAQREAADLEKAAVRDLDHVRRLHGAADLARHLEAGEACPVCEQVVDKLPDRPGSPGLDAAEMALAAAKEAHESARRHLEGAGRRKSEAAVLLNEKRSSAADLLASLSGHPGLDEIEAGAAALDKVANRLGRARAEEEAAQAALEVARTSAENAEASLRPWWDSFRKLRDRVAAHAPPQPTEDIEDSWRELVRWTVLKATEVEARRDERLEEAAAKRKTAEKGMESLRQRCRDHGVPVSASESPASRCAEALGDASANVRNVRARLGERRRVETGLAAAQRREETLAERIRKLERELKGAPSPAEITETLGLVSAADSELEQAESTQAEADRLRAEYAREHADLTEQVDEDHRRFSLERDRLAELGPPPPEGDLVALWTCLREWNEAKARELEAEEEATRRKAEARRAEEAELRTGLVESCRIAGLDLEKDGEPASLCAEALGAVNEQRLSLGADLEKRRETERELVSIRRSAAVAKELGEHLSTRKFGRWLQHQVLSWLTAGATVRLKELSGGQYSLEVSAQSEFLVVDHRNGDEVRSAKTLSGGETFLASLALALSLAEHVAGLASRGSPKLEALFLDEGFGALDPETLDTVATSIEQLGAERMVGLVTHVTELAERIPVQYRVRKVNNASRVRRVEG